MHLGFRLSIWTVMTAMLVLSLPAPSAHAQLGPPVVRDPQVYIKMDFWKSPDEQSAQAWHFDPNNGNQWTQLPNDPAYNLAKPRARFPFRRLFLESELEFPWIWFMGVPGIKVLRGSPGSFEDVSNNPDYSEMIEFMVMGFDPTTCSMTAHDPCGERIWPIAAGSDLTPYTIGDIDSFRYYAMRMVQKMNGFPHTEGLLQSAVWRWKNPAGLAEEDVYLEFTLRFDLADQNIEFNTYFDTHVSWISAGGGCGYTFCLTTGTATKTGTPYNLMIGDHLLVLAVPHVLDRTAGLQLYKRNGNQNTLLVNSLIGNANSHPTSHKCDPDGALIPSHTHASGAAGHLLKGGLSPKYFAPLEPLIATDEVFTTSWFDVPAHTVAGPVNHQALYMLFWRPTFVPPDP